MPSKKGSIAYELRLLRRKAQRRVKSLTKKLESATSESDRGLFRESIEEFNRQIESSYQKTAGGRRKEGISKGMLEVAKSNLQKSTATTKNISEEQARRNFIAQQQLNAGSRKSGISDYTAEEVSIFYAATKQAWQGKDPSRRNEIIMEYYGATDLQDLVDKVLRQNIEVIKAIIEKKQTNTDRELTEEQKALYDKVMSDEVDSMDSKEVMELVNKLNEKLMQSLIEEPTTTEE